MRSLTWFYNSDTIFISNSSLIFLYFTLLCKKCYGGGMKQKKFLIEILAIGLLIFFISQFFIQICFVNGNSMYPTLKNRDFLFIKKINLNIKKNDIVVIRKENKTIIKRVVGVPHDTILIKDGKVLVNDVEFDTRYTSDYGRRETITLLEDQYYVLGDNREHSIDSRSDEIGIINKKEIKGIMLFNKENRS